MGTLTIECETGKASLAALCEEIETLIRIRHHQTTFCTLILRSLEWSDGERKPE